MALALILRHLTCFFVDDEAFPRSVHLRWSNIAANCPAVKLLARELWTLDDHSIYVTHVMTTVDYSVTRDIRLMVVGPWVQMLGCCCSYGYMHSETFFGVRQWANIGTCHMVCNIQAALTLRIPGVVISQFSTAYLFVR